MKLLTESHSLYSGGIVRLSGRSTGIGGVGQEILGTLTGGSADVVFRKTDDAAKKLVQEKLGTEYTENPEGFIMDIGDTVTVYADTDRAALYAAYALRAKHPGGIEKGIVYSYPSVPHRSIRVFLPPKSEMDYFRKTVDLLVQLGYNAILLEIGGVMEYKKHPEINDSWAEYCRSMQEYNGKTYTASSVYKYTKNSIHTYNGNGDIYTQEEMRELAAYCRERCIEIIPEVPSLTHSEYILISHPEFRECGDEPFASTACPSNPDFYNLVFDLYDEVIDVFRPSVLHIGHDEWWVMCVCDRCKDKKASDLFVADVMKSYEYLKARGIRTMMWGDKPIRVTDKAGESHGGAEKHVYNVKTDRTLQVLGKEYPIYKRYWFQAPPEAMENGVHQIIHDTADCMDQLPKDILYVNWYWSVEPRILDEYLTRGMDMIYGNCNPASLNNYKERVRAGAKGLSVSNWVETTEKGMQAWGTVFGMGYGAALCWGHGRKEWEYEQNVLDVMRELYLFRNRDTLNMPHLEAVHTLTESWKEGDTACGQPYYDEEALTVGEYRIEYADGTLQHIPVQYRIHIGTRNARLVRWDSARNWMYSTDAHMTMTASVCDLVKDSDGIWYKTVFPLREGALQCSFVPREGFDTQVLVKQMEILPGKKN